MNQRDLDKTMSAANLVRQALLIADIVASGLEPEDLELQVYVELRAEVFGDDL